MLSIFFIYLISFINSETYEFPTIKKPEGSLFSWYSILEMFQVFGAFIPWSTIPEVDLPSDFKPTKLDVSKLIKDSFDPLKNTIDTAEIINNFLDPNVSDPFSNITNFDDILDKFNQSAQTQSGMDSIELYGFSVAAGWALLIGLIVVVFLLGFLYYLLYMLFVLLCCGCCCC